MFKTMQREDSKNNGWRILIEGSCHVVSSRDPQH